MLRRLIWPALSAAVAVGALAATLAHIARDDAQRAELRRCNASHHAAQPQKEEGP